MPFSFSCKFVNIIVHNKPRFSFLCFQNKMMYRFYFGNRVKTKFIITEHMFFVKRKMKIYTSHGAGSFHDEIKQDILFFHGIENCSYSRGTSTRIAIAILLVQSMGFVLFHGIENCSYSRGTSIFYISIKGYR